MALSLNSFRINAATTARSAAVAGMILSGAAFTARAEVANPFAQPTTTGSINKQLLDQGECVRLISMASTEFLAAGQGREKPNSEFPESLAKFIVPSNPGPIQSLIEKGTFGKLASSKTAKDMETKRAMIPTITCDGPPYIVVEGRGIAMWNTIEDFYYQSKTMPVDLRARGLKPIGRAEYKAFQRSKVGPQSQAVPAPRG